jgi:digeranylgeranylglycerophospholipid reductase
MNTTKRVDILVVGGGPAGLATAEAAASSGCSVLVVEREDAIGKPVHTSGATAVRTMIQFAIPKSLYHVVNRLRIVGPTESAVFEFDGDVACIMDVTGVYGHLAARAQERGALVRTGTRAVRTVSQDGTVSGCEIEGREGSEVVSSKVLVDASGYRALIARQAGLHAGFQRFGVGAEYELLAPSCDQTEAVIVVGSRYAPAGYGWVFPWGQGRVRVGVGVLHADTRANPASHLDLLVREADQIGIDLRGSHQIEEHRGLIPSDGLATSFVGNGVMAVGDAAGQPALIVGEGIRLSLVAGTEAGRVAAAAAGRGRTDRNALMSYERRFRSRYGRRLEIGSAINRRMAQWDDSEWDEKIGMIRGIPANLMAELLQSNFPLAGLARWLLTRPAQWPRVFRYGLRGLSYVLNR